MPNRGILFTDPKSPLMRLSLSLITSRPLGPLLSGVFQPHLFFMFSNLSRID